MKTPLKIAIIGVTGNAGKKIAEEALNRGHHVTGIARNVDGITPGNNLTLLSGDINDPDALAGLLKGHDLIVSSVKYHEYDHEKLLKAVRLSGIKRYYVVGGAGTLEVAPGISGLNSGYLPDFIVPVARAAQDYLDLLLSSEDLYWTVLAPGAEFISGKRTGKFRLGNHELIKDKNGNSGISFEDYAIALLDEIETPRHVKDYFSIGY